MTKVRVARERRQWSTLQKDPVSSNHEPVIQLRERGEDTWNRKWRSQPHSTHNRRKRRKRPSEGPEQTGQGTALSAFRQVKGQRKDFVVSAGGGYWQGAYLTFVKYPNFKISYLIVIAGRSQWPRGLRRRSLAARLLRLWVRIPPGAWIFVCCECCVLPGRGLCDGLIIRSEESYRMWSVVVCDQETS